LNQSAHGDREFGYTLTRLGVRRKTVAGHWKDPAVVDRIASWGRAASGLREARSLRVARFGDNMRQVACTDGDKVEAHLRLGLSVEGYGVAELADAVRSAPPGEVDDLVAEYENSYELAPPLRRDGEHRDALRAAASIEIGLSAFLESGGFGAFTDTFEDLAGLPQLPGIAVQRLMERGYGFGAEGDWKTAAFVRIAKVMADELPGGTSFMEDYTYHLGPETPKVLGAHMLEVCPSITDAVPSCELHPLSIGGKPDPVRLVFAAAPGEGVVLGIADLGERLRLVANSVRVVTPPEPLPRLPVAHAMWEPKPDFATAAAAWLMAGGPHHTVLSTALGTEPLVDFAEMAGLELVLIDDASSTVQHAKELRWNEAYHQLTRGLR
jgi:L-arabinose isomerase